MCQILTLVVCLDSSKILTLVVCKILTLVVCLDSSEILLVHTFYLPDPHLLHKHVSRLHNSLKHLSLSIFCELFWAKHPDYSAFGAQGARPCHCIWVTEVHRSELSHTVHVSNTALPEPVYRSTSPRCVQSSSRHRLSACSQGSSQALQLGQAALTLASLHVKPTRRSPLTLAFCPFNCIYSNPVARMKLPACGAMSVGAHALRW